MESFPLVLLVVWVVGAAIVWPLWFLHRRRRMQALGVPLRPRIPAGAAYGERRASGRAKGQLGGASNALLVAVSDGELWVLPIFPFSLIGGFKLEQRVPASDVVLAERRKSWEGGNTVVELRDGTVLALKLRDPDAFLNALRVHGARMASPP